MNSGEVKSLTGSETGSCRILHFLRVVWAELNGKAAISLVEEYYLRKAHPAERFFNSSGLSVWCWD